MTFFGRPKNHLVETIGSLVLAGYLSCAHLVSLVGKVALADERRIGSTNVVAGSRHKATSFLLEFRVFNFPWRDRIRRVVLAESEGSIP